MALVRARTGNHGFGRLATLLLTVVALLAGQALANPRDQAKRIHDRVTGTPPDEATLDLMEAEVTAGDPLAAALIATNQHGFYDVTLKNLVTPWTNEAGDVFAPLNDYTATVIGIVRDDRDFREILHGDVLYVGNSSLGLPAYSPGNNAHYEELESRSIHLRDNLVFVPQSSLSPVPSHATAGIITTRAAAKAFFIDGTNRAMFRFTLVNHLCKDFEEVSDPTRSPDRIPQDASRSPGGDARVWMNFCLGCHAGMDPLNQALSYYDYERNAVADPEGLFGAIHYNDVGQLDPDTGSRVERKYRQNSSTFPWAYVVIDESWINYWREGPNKNLGWDPALPGSGDGAKEMGRELAHSQAFSQCQVEKVFANVCLRDPSDSADHTQISTMVTSFVNSGYSLRQVFAESAAYCMGE